MNDVKDIINSNNDELRYVDKYSILKNKEGKYPL